MEAALKDCVHQTCRKPLPPKSIQNDRFLKMEKVGVDKMTWGKKWNQCKNTLKS